jgi:hypothetical protein
LLLVRSGHVASLGEDDRFQAKGTARRTAAACDVGVPRRMDS